MDETEAYEAEPVQTVGQTLRAAREEQGKSIEDIAASTRIPTRHLESLEEGAWERLPAPTYTMGFAKAYAGEVGLDRAQIGDRLRGEMGGYTPVPAVSQDYFAPADPKRTIPIGLVAGVLVGLVVLALGLNWLLNRDLNAPDTVAATDDISNVAQTAAAPPPLTVPGVKLTATDAVWVDIRDGQTVLKQGEMRSGETFDVPGNALEPTISTAKPEALTINVGTNTAPPIGPAGRKVTASLKAEELMRAPAPSAATSPAPRPSAAAATRRPARSSVPSPAPATAPASTEPAPAAEGTSQ